MKRKRGNIISITHPHLAIEWSKELNGCLPNLSFGSNKRVWWECQTCKYQWLSSPNTRTNMNTGCIKCSIKKRPQNIPRDLSKNKFLQLQPLYIMRIDPTKRRGRVIWLCRCDCGNTTEVSSNDLCNKRTKSCGHCNDPKINDIFGKLTVQSINYNRCGGGCRVVCLCECGNIWSGFGSSLTNGNTQSCGCNDSRGEFIIAKILQNLNIQFVKEKSFDDCISIRRLRFDFYLPKYNICIEYHGKQHYDGKGWRMTNLEFRGLKHRDNTKRTYCKKNNIRLLEIPYTSFDDLEKIIKEAIS